ncbi:Lipase, class 3 [Heracleum sosnowskyi]|uniref:Lipase, class 3 n=1 Tax=Heracleum sosnowskyi TaxID=360622 RepID=A0AAD8GW40_9APIA|nr:Lipase, class 3 [Heracleum sosnowskyi]
MQIGLTLPVQNMNIFSTRSSGFNCNGSSAVNAWSRNNVNVSCSSVKTISTTKITRKHLSSLEKLLHKDSDLSSLEEVNVVEDEKIATQKSAQENKGRGLLEALNLSRIWPESKAAEEVSPRQLIRLKRMLSKTGEYSPRNNLGSKWREYHGSNNWSGLLDPLDENLRREMVRYGEFIQAAYHCFHSNPATSASEAPVDCHVAVPDKAYKVTKNLYATASVGLPKWVDNVAPDLAWITQRSSCLGYVAVCQDQREIARMGRRDIVIALRGTATCLEWAENMRDVLVQMPDEEANKGDANGVQSISKVECGFLSLYKSTSGPQMPSLSESVVSEIQRLVEMYKGENLSITITGHSLGAAMALLVADELSSSSAANMPPIAVFSFGGPRVGNRGFANRLNSKNVKVLRIVNSQDVITRVPGMFVNEKLDKKLRDSGTAANVLNILDNNMPWAYSHVGTELRVDTKMSPFLKPDADVACCHDLEAYLHLVDGFLASNCPFRSNAKRSLVKLLDEQNANVKKLYTNKANALTLKLNPQREILQMSSCLPSPSS